MPAQWHDLLWSMGKVAAAVLVAFLVAHVLLMVAHALLARRHPALDRVLTRHCRGPLLLLLPVLTGRVMLAGLTLPDTLREPSANALAILVIISVAWLCARLVAGIEAMILEFHKIDVKDNLEARKIHTQIRFLKKLLVTVIVLVAGASILMMFERVRQLGTSLLASAGILGIVVGLAAQKVIANLLVGLQIALTQPIRIDDVVIIENEWGKIEEITSTYIVVRIWDLRRLVVPLTYFVEKPFQNWTRVSADLLGTVFLHVDYTVPVARIREELHAILQRSSLWDGKAWNLQVTDCGEKTMELRALMSAPDASAAWDLRCEVREQLIDFVQRHFPESLPRLRAEVDSKEEHPENRRMSAGFAGAADDSSST